MNYCSINLDGLVTGRPEVRCFWVDPFGCCVFFTELVDAVAFHEPDFSPLDLSQNRKNEYSKTKKLTENVRIKQFLYGFARKSNQQKTLI